MHVYSPKKAKLATTQYFWYFLSFSDLSPLFLSTKFS